MSSIDRYLSDGKFSRIDLVDDIARLKISKEDLMSLLGCEEIKSYFFESIKFQKTEKSKWNHEYLNDLKAKAVAECFTQEYLMHLYDVACFVNNHSSNPVSKNLICVLGILLLLFIFVLSQCNAKKNKRSMENITEQTSGSPVFL